MNTQTSDGRRPVTMRDSVAALRLVPHRPASGQAAPQINVTRAQHRDARPNATPAHQPSTAECYGCVDWFQF
jgi:hypothetical protein